MRGIKLAVLVSLRQDESGACLSQDRSPRKESEERMQLAGSCGWRPGVY
jgi:hypothetical protein